MPEHNDHGWGKPIGSVTMGGAVAVAHIAAPVDERERCGCRRDFCIRKATQEDLLCDQCRETCA